MSARVFMAIVASAILLAFAAATPAAAQTNVVFRSFGPSLMKGGINGYLTNSDGINPSGWQTLAAGRLLGTTQKGGPNGSGTIYSLTTNGVFQLLYSFPVNNFGNTYGANPNGGLVVPSGKIYGTAAAGGTYDQGVVFSINTNGTSIAVLKTFSAIDVNSGTNTDGANPYGGLVLQGNMLYGTTRDGGTNANGTVFTINTNGGSFSVIHHFLICKTNAVGIYTNTEGANPLSTLLLSGAMLFGTTSAGGTNGCGTIFSVKTNGQNFAVLHHFNTNAANSASPLVLSGKTLFGVSGSILYAINTNGSGFTVIEQFESTVDGQSAAISGLIVTNATIYAAIARGHLFGYGNIFSINTNGSGYADSCEFFPTASYPATATNSGGAYPNGGLILLNNSLYGTTVGGGAYANGVLFRAPPPESSLSSQVSGTNFLFSFQTFNGMNYIIQKSTNLALPGWITHSNLMGDGSVKQFSVPLIDPPSLYFRLRQPF